MSPLGRTFFSNFVGQSPSWGGSRVWTRAANLDCWPVQHPSKSTSIQTKADVNFYFLLILLGSKSEDLHPPHGSVRNLFTVANICAHVSLARLLTSAKYILHHFLSNLHNCVLCLELACSVYNTSSLGQMLFLNNLLCQNECSSNSYLVIPNAFITEI